MKIWPILILLPLVIESMDLDNKEFLIYNGKWRKARLAMWGTGGHEVGTTEGPLYDDQIWTLKPDKKTGCYYIVNKHHPQYRIADSKHKLVTYKGTKWPDQLFSFKQLQGVWGGVWVIKNCHYTSDMLGKWEEKDWLGTPLDTSGDRDVGFVQYIPGHGFSRRTTWSLITPGTKYP